MSYFALTTPEYEEQLMEQYEPMLQRIVNSFQRRCSWCTTDTEDLMQEARLAFWEHIKTHEQQDYQRCYLTIKRALYDAVRRDYPVYVPYWAFRTGNHDRVYTINHEAVEIPTGVDMFGAVELQNMLSLLEEREQQLIRMRLEGIAIAEAARRIGISYTQAYRTLHRIRQRFKNERL